MVAGKQEELKDIKWGKFGIEHSVNEAYLPKLTYLPLEVV
jgi:hypothetical protein